MATTRRGAARDARCGVTVLVAAVLASLLGACGASATSPRSRGTTVTTAAPGSLQAAAVDWAHAFLTGTVQDILGMQGPSCAGTTPTTIDAHVADGYLRATRAEMTGRFGRAPDRIEILGVSVRNVTATRGEAEVRYDLPRSVTGNDNWVEYERVDGKWKVADCHAPIGGESTSSSGSSPAPGG